MNYGFIKVGTYITDIAIADCKSNTERIIAAISEAASRGVKVLCFPELCITGYTCGDLFRQSVLLDAAKRSLLEITEASVGIDMLFAVGLPMQFKGKLYNCAAVIYSGRLLGIVPQTYTDIEYRGRYFAAAPTENSSIVINGKEVPFGSNLIFNCENIENLTIAIEISTDLWASQNPSQQHTANGANVILNLAAGEEIIGKAAYRRSLVTVQSVKMSCAYVYASAGTGESTQDNVFAGHSLICENGRLLAESKLFENTMLYTDIDVDRISANFKKIPTFHTSYDYTYIPFEFYSVDNRLDRIIPQYPFVPDCIDSRNKVCTEALEIQAIGLKKRIEHTKAKSVVVGISGGLDSTLAILAAAKAIDMCNRPRTDIIAVTMPCFGTTARTKSNAEKLCESLGVTLRIVDISEAVKVHFRDIEQAEDNYDVTFENAQARERTQVLMDISNQTGGFVLGTGDLSELALGWATYNGDHMSMYGVNASIPKTLIRHMVSFIADAAGEGELSKILNDILDTPVSPELLPPENGDIAQRTEKIVGPYDLHDFFLFYVVRYGFSPRKILYMAQHAFKGTFEADVIKYWLKIFIRRFFSQQFKRSCLPDGPAIGSVSLSPRGSWHMPSDALADEWLSEI